MIQSVICLKKRAKAQKKLILPNLLWKQKKGTKTVVSNIQKKIAKLYKMFKQMIIWNLKLP